MRRVYLVIMSFFVVSHIHAQIVDMDELAVDFFRHYLLNVGAMLEENTFAVDVSESKVPRLESLPKYLEKKIFQDIPSRLRDLYIPYSDLPEDSEFLTLYVTGVKGLSNGHVLIYYNFVYLERYEVGAQGYWEGVRDKDGIWRFDSEAWDEWAPCDECMILAPKDPLLVEQDDEPNP